MSARIFLLLSLALILTGCADMTDPGSKCIHEERTVSPASTHRSLVMSEPLDWCASAGKALYDIWLPQGTYHVEAEDSDYWYFRAPEKVSLGKSAFFSNQGSSTSDGGIFISKSDSSKYSSGAYIDNKSGKKLLLFHFDLRFTVQEGKRWHYVDE